MPKCDFNKVAIQLATTLRHGCSPANMSHIFRTPFSNNTSGGLLLQHPLITRIILSDVYDMPYFQAIFHLVSLVFVFDQF